MSLGVLLIQFQFVFFLSLFQAFWIQAHASLKKIKPLIMIQHSYAFFTHTHIDREKEKEWERRWRGSNNRIRKLTSIRIYKSPSSYERKSRKVKRNHWQKGRFSCWKLDSSSSCPSLLFLFVCVCAFTNALFYIFTFLFDLMRFFSFIAVNTALLYVNASKLEIINLVVLCESKKDFRLLLLFVWNNAALFGLHI